jgi:hypothetical protein
MKAGLVKRVPIKTLHNSTSIVTLWERRRFFIAWLEILILRYFKYYSCFLDYDAER